jgi:hypothetical protein
MRSVEKPIVRRPAGTRAFARRVIPTHSGSCHDFGLRGSAASTTGKTIMGTARMEAFSDGVIAVALTIMVLGQQVPEGTDLASLMTLAPQLLTYILSFVYVGIYWTNHHP